jgi:radical SAM family RiPP maturation amino acid epimerase
VEVPTLFRECHREPLRGKVQKAFADRPDQFRPLLPQRIAHEAPFASEVAHTKRFLERWCADRTFRGALREDPYAAATRFGLAADPEEIRYLWDQSHAVRMIRERERAPLAVQRYRVWIAEKILHREELRLEGCVPADVRHRTWRERQVNRSRTQLGPSALVSIVHAPFTVELSDGCSVGCWFCGVSAGKKRSDFLYTEENRELWRDVLGVLRKTLGTAAAAGFCYWATDPLDNPDYEKFLADFAEICGRCPQTTTAQPHKDVERTRALLRKSAELGCEINRFSILNLRIFDQVMRAFTAEELLHTELVLQNREATQMQSNSGRARGSRQLRSRAEAGERPPESWEEAPGTISCVSGFHMNMVHRTVRLITPCPSSDRWPSGHWVYEETRFDDAAHLHEILHGMMERHMRTALRSGDPLRLRRDLRVEVFDDGFAALGYGGSIAYRDNPLAREIGEALRVGDSTAGELALRLEDRGGASAPEVFDLLNQIFHQGLLEEEPAVLALASSSAAPADDADEASPILSQLAPLIRPDATGAVAPGLEPSVPCRPDATSAVAPGPSMP